MASSSSGAQIWDSKQRLPGLSLLQATMRALERVGAGAGPPKQEAM